MEKNFEEREIFHFELKWNQDEERENENLSIIGYRLQNDPSVKKKFTVRTQDQTVRHDPYSLWDVRDLPIWMASFLPSNGRRKIPLIMSHLPLPGNEKMF